MFKLQLLSRQDCHLCDEAIDLIKETLVNHSVEVVDIDTDLGLIRAYGDRVPVLRSEASDHELGWPFDSTMLLNWLASVG